MLCHSGVSTTTAGKREEIEANSRNQFHPSVRTPDRAGAPPFIAADSAGCLAKTKNPWKLKPVLICATPIAGALLQVIILGFSTGTADTARRYALNEVITIGVLFLPLVSVPALLVRCLCGALEPGRLAVGTSRALC